MQDTFRGDTPHLIRSIEALLSLDADGALAPHELGGHARDLLSSAASRLSAPTDAQQAVTQANLVPGQMHCARCKFQLTRTVLYMGNGATGAGDSKTEPCPNGCGPLWPVTWEQAARDAWATNETMFERAKKAEDALQAVAGPRLVADQAAADHETVVLTRAQIEDLRRIIHDNSAPLGNRLQDVSSRLYFALEGAGWTPTPAPATELSIHEQRAVLADLMGLECLINHHDAQEAGADAIGPGLGKANARRVLELLKIGREIIAEDPEAWHEEQKKAFALRYSERAAAASSKGDTQ